MNFAPTQQRTGPRPFATWAAVATLSMGVLFGSSSALAAAPPSGTQIGNKAYASYRDPNGTAQTASSNEVTTTVQQVGSFTLDTVNQVTTTVVNTKTGGAGQIVYAQHTIANTGNGTDGFAISVASTAGTFSNVAVYADMSPSDGQPDGAALCSVAAGTACSVPAQTIAGNTGSGGNTYTFVVAYTIPATATTPTTPFSSGTVTVTPSTAALYTAPNTSAADVDNVNLTTLAAFSLSKVVAQPGSGITAPGGGTWPAAPGSGQRSSLASCATTWTAGLTSSATCQYTVYTINYSNTGGASGRFNLRDTIGTGATSGMTYVAGSAVWSGAPGTALGDGTGSDPAGVDWLVSGNTLTFVDNAMPVSSTRSVSFVVLVNSTAAVGTTTTNNQATFNPLDATGATAAAPVGVTTASSNFASFAVSGTYAVALGSTSSTSATAVDATAGTPNGTTAAGADTTVVASVSTSQPAAFTQVVYNNGNTTDTFTLAAASTGTGGGTAFPAGTTFAFFKADGVTPLTDTGPVPAGTSINVVVKATLPGSTAAAAGPLGYVVTVTATSVGDSTKKDATRDVLNAITGVLVDLTNSAAGQGTGAANDDLGTGPSTAPTTTNTVAAGSTTAFPLFVKNNDTGFSNTYTLAAAANSGMTGLPSGWTVKFAAGAVTSSSCASAAAITTVAVTAGAQQQVTACVTPPASQAAVTAQPIYFQVRSTLTTSTGSVVVDTKYDAVTVTAAVATLAATITPAGTGEVSPTGTIVYPHNLTATGTASCTGPYTVTATFSAADQATGWTASVWSDVDGNAVLNTPTDTLVTGAIAGPVNPGAANAAKYLVKVSSGGAAVGTTAVATITVTFTGTPACNTTITDSTTVVTGQVSLAKTQAINATCNGTPDTAYGQAAISAKPGQCVIYQITATNNGSAVVTNLSLSDAPPSWTSLTSSTNPTGGAQPGTAATQCVSTGMSGTAVAYVATASSVSCGSAVNSMNPGGTATLTFSVRVNP